MVSLPKTGEKQILQGGSLPSERNSHLPPTSVASSQGNGLEWPARRPELSSEDSVCVMKCLRQDTAGNGKL